MKYAIKAERLSVAHQRWKAPCSHVEVKKAGHVLAQDVELDVNDRPNLDITEIGILSGIGNDGHLKTIVRRLTYGQRNAVHGDAALVYGDVTTLGHHLVEWIFKREIG